VHALKAALTLLAAAALLLAGCGSATPPNSAAHSAAASPSAPAAHFTVPTKTFTSAQLGISFRYPASWQLDDSLDAASTFAQQGDGMFVVHSPKGAKQQAGVEVHISSTRVFASKPAQPYMGVPAAAVHHLGTFDKQMKVRPIQVSIVVVAGLRLLSMDNGRHRASIRPVDRTSSWPGFTARSRSCCCSRGACGVGRTRGPAHKPESPLPPTRGVDRGPDRTWLYA
jgi:hypothetical protein